MEIPVMVKNVFCFVIDTEHTAFKVGEFGSFQIFEQPKVKDILKDWEIVTMSQSNVGTTVYLSILCQRYASTY
jgi:hypothetical protein